MKSISFILIGLTITFQISFAQKTVIKDFSKHFEKHGVEGCFALYNPTDDLLIQYNKDRCNTGYIPASTFKIPNSLIVLEEGIVKDTSQIIKWDGKSRGYDMWDRDQTLRTAMKYSCVWAYVGFASQISTAKYQSYMDAFNYGNRNITGPENYFWLEGEFKISANQQIEFLKRFYNNQLGISKQNTDIVKSLIVIEERDDYKLFAKTGAGVRSKEQDIMWLVGYVEKDKVPYFFALNFITNDFKGTKNARNSIAKDIFEELGLIEAN
jgi:beta-lactamase class D